MADVKQYQEQIGNIFNTSWKRGRIRVEMSINNVDEAKRMLKTIRQQQKELRLIKKHVGADMSAIRKSYQSAIDKVGSGSGVAGLFIGKGRAAGIKASEKRQLRNKRDKALQPYNAVKLTIEDLLTQLDATKLRLEQYIQEQGA